jgi:hypothetical protein
MVRSAHEVRNVMVTRLGEGSGSSKVRTSLPAVDSSLRVDSTRGSIRNLVESLVFLTMCRAMYHDVLGQAEYWKPA